jgi:hypothetical protein
VLDRASLVETAILAPRLRAPDFVVLMPTPAREFQMHAQQAATASGLKNASQSRLGIRAWAGQRAM